jgi:acyl-CoA hydrolase
MMEFMNDNPAVEVYPLSYTNDPEIIARNDKMISINATLQVDLTGQCNSEYLEGAQFSATGGQLDFVRGAVNLKGKCMRDRAPAIISIAHPDFRDELMREAEKMRLF